MDEPHAARLAFAGVDRVVADPLRFKQRLRIGEDAYALTRARKAVQQWWDVGGFAWAGAGAASSSAVANTFFGYTASQGVLAYLGLGVAAATPVGWVAAAAIVSGGAYWGVSRLFGRVNAAMVDTIPKFINTPVDVLGIALFDLMGALAVRIGMIDGRFVAAERAVILDHFERDWGYDPVYLTHAIDVILAESDANRVKALAQALASFQAANPDCNAPAMQAELMTLLREVAQADGVMDEREEMALDTIARVFARERGLSVTSIQRGVGNLAETVSGAATEAAGSVRTATQGLVARIGRGRKQTG